MWSPFYTLLHLTLMTTQKVIKWLPVSVLETPRNRRALLSFTFRRSLVIMVRFCLVWCLANLAMLGRPGRRNTIILVTEQNTAQIQDHSTQRRPGESPWMTNRRRASHRNSKAMNPFWWCPSFRGVCHLPSGVSISPWVKWGATARSPLRCLPP